jgi:glycerol-3-phosphate O-acyltransferase/dihydroxyacetone phosphate acyltransferase
VNTTLFDAVVAFLRLVVRVFFRTIEVVGKSQIPVDGPVMFVGNHPNSLLDPALITTMCGRRVRFAAKDTLFESAPFRVILRALGAVPIKRRQDHDDKMAASGEKLDNSAAFDALFHILEEGDAFGIFPEGISHAMSELAPLKTGAARIALGARAKGIPVTVIPCGLIYRRRERMRSRVLVQYGAPIDIDEALVLRFRTDAKGAAQELTDRVELALRALTINARDFDTLRVLDAVRRLYQPKGKKLTLAERSEISRRFISHYEEMKADPDVRALYSDVEAYLFKLSALGMSDSDLLRPISRLSSTIRVAQHLLLTLVWVPLALPGIIVHAPVLIAAVFAGEALTTRKDVKSTTKLMVATALTLSVYAAIVAFFVVVSGVKRGLVTGPLTVAVLLASGWATIRVLERQSVLRRGLSTLMQLMNLTKEVEAMKHTRDELRARTLALVDQHIDPTLSRVVAREDQT